MDDSSAIISLDDSESVSKFVSRWQSTHLGLVDSRLNIDFTTCHISGSTSLPNDQLSERAGDLPPRGNSVCLISGSKEELALVTKYLVEHDYKVALAAYLDSSVFQETHPFLTKNSSLSAIIWEPSPVLKGVIEKIESLRVESGLTPYGTAVDIACGSGRDCVFLAHRHWKSIGYDHLEDSLERARLLAQRFGTTIETVLQDLEIEAPVLSHKADLVTVARYLHRPLFPLIANMLNPGGFLVYHTFMVGCEKPRRARFLLAEGELNTAFSELGFDIIDDKIFNISDGRPCSWFLARKRST